MDAVLHTNHMEGNMTLEQQMAGQLQASNRIIELLVECYMTGRRLSRVEALQCQVCVDDNRAVIAQSNASTLSAILA